MDIITLYYYDEDYDYDDDDDQNDDDTILFDLQCCNHF